MEAPIACAACGFALGTGIPGGTAWCNRCGAFVYTRALQQDWSGLFLGLFAIGIGILLAIALSKA